MQLKSAPSGSCVESSWTGIKCVSLGQRTLEFDMKGDDGEGLVSHEHHICTHGLSVVEGDDVVAEQLVNNALLFFQRLRKSTTSQRA